MASSAAQRRLRKEYGTLSTDPPPGCAVEPLESNLLHAHFLLGVDPTVFRDTPYEGGIYHGELRFPRNYPLGPPTVIVHTPSGRFKPGAKICFSMSDFHPELWNPMWSIRSILTGLVSFMNSDEITTGGVDAPRSYREGLARRSLAHCWEKNVAASSLFGDVLRRLSDERRELGPDVWPPPRPRASAPPPPPAQTSAASYPYSGPRPVSGHDSMKDANGGSSPPAGGGKNAAKNKKRKERDRRRKAARRFLADLKERVPMFVESVCAALQTDEHKIDVSEYPADHVCWRTESLDEYTELVLALRSVGSDICALLVESEVGGRSIATFRLAEGIQCGADRTVDVVEIPAPKEKSVHKTGLEHVEFVISGVEGKPMIDSPMNDEGQHRVALENFLNRYPHVQWNLKAMGKAINPDVSLKVVTKDFGTCSVKFHLLPLSKVIEFEKAADC